MLGISSCLAGIACRYDGNHNEIKQIKDYLADHEAVLICPEVLGEMSTPRTPAEIVGGDGFDVWQEEARVIDKNGQDVTESFKQGAIRAYEKLEKQQITELILKERSPSCGSKKIYDGTFSGTKINGVGVATAYFINHGIKIYSEESQLEGVLNGN